MQAYPFTEPTRQEMARLRAETREQFYDEPPRLTKEERKARIAANLPAKARAEAKRVEKEIFRRTVNTGRVADPRDYKPLAQTSREVVQIIEKKLAPKPHVPYEIAKTRRQAKIEALREYDRRYGTRLAPRPTPAVLKTRENGEVVSWPDLVRFYFKKYPDASMKERMMRASNEWNSLTGVKIRPDIVEKAKAAVARKPPTSETLAKREAAKEKLKARAEEKAYLLKTNPEEFAQQYANERFYAKLREDQRVARLTQRRLGLTRKISPALKYAETDDGKFLASRSDFTRIYGHRFPAGIERKRGVDELWKAAKPYLYRGEIKRAVEAKLRKEPLQSYRGVAVMGRGVYGYEPEEAVAEEILERYKAAEYKLPAENPDIARRIQQAAEERRITIEKALAEEAIRKSKFREAMSEQEQVLLARIRNPIVVTGSATRAPKSETV